MFLFRGVLSPNTHFVISLFLEDHRTYLAVKEPELKSCLVERQANQRLSQQQRQRQTKTP